MGKTCGAVYIATGAQYVDEAMGSIRSLKEETSDINITLHTNDKGLVGKNEVRLLDSINTIESYEGHYGDSIITPNLLPYDKNLVLDTDTYVSGDITPVFSLLSEFDIAAAHNPGSRVSRDIGGNVARDVPNAFPLYNTGVVGLKRCQSVYDFLDNWETKYDELMNRSDSRLNQPAFREALYESNLRIATLPSEYNCRIRYRGSVGFLTSDVKIIHGRHPVGISNLERKLNKDSGMRVFTTKRYPLQLINRSPGLIFYLRSIMKEMRTNRFSSYSFIGRFRDSIKKRGTLETIEKTTRDLLD
ncbi:hypothetical protein [Natrialba taiwanensis]|uniref:Uncharacterized protein n=1 Tax=Natrialba taiwanensis DSM 12281 TaxID=1230458 RepID=L9ZXH8_9EURY|nr:hypothetical protein [Natrialba taiwanensis]ELY90791.1 hypothetical protein C484_11226 [Natrialba taiwanensis DSM 12281]